MKMISQNSHGTNLLWKIALLCNLDDSVIHDNVCCISWDFMLTKYNIVRLEQERTSCNSGETEKIHK